MDWDSLTPEEQAQVEALYNSAFGNQGAVPEYSVSRGWQPVDIGTLAKNLNYQQDVRSNAMDPFVGAITGYMDPSVFEPIREYKMPERPQLPKLTLYSGSRDEGKQLMLARLAEGADPYQVALELQQAGLIPDRDGSTARFDATVKEAGDLQMEIYAYQDYQQQSENPQFTETPSAASQKFIDDGFSDPSLRYEDAQLNPNLPGAEAKATESANAFHEALQQISGARLRDSLLQYATPPAAGGSDEVDHFNISRDGSRLEKAAAKVYLSGREAVDTANSAADWVPSMNTADTARSLAKAWGWLTKRPSADDGSERDPQAAMIEELRRRGGGNDGPGIYDRALSGFANYVQNNTTARDPSVLRKNFEQAAKNQGASQLKMSEERYRAALMQASGRTPFMDQYMGRTGL